MALTFLYRDLDATDTDVTPYVVLRFGQNPQGMAENAEERSVGAWDLEIEDNGVLDLHAQRTFYVLEDDTDYADDVLWVGQTFDKHSVRGDTWRTGAGRVYTLSLIDLNTLLERRVIQAGDDPDRPEETDVERMQWLEGLGYIGGPSDYLSTADPVDMDAVDYTGRMASEVIEDCMGQSGKNAFMFRDPDNNIFSTFYGDSSADIDVLTSDIRLSNVLSDIDNVTTFEVNLDADQWEANSRIYSGLFASYDGGAVYQENATTVANFSHRDTSVSWPDVKTSTKANARAIRYLADIGTEEVRITAALEVGSDQVGLFPHAGYRLQARFSHFPLFAAVFTWMRILSRNTTLIGPNRYRIQYELSPGTTHPLVCSAADLPDDHYQSAYVPGGSPPVSLPVVTPTTYPAVVFVSSQFGSASAPGVTSGGGYTTLGGDKGPNVSVSSGDYKAVTSGAPGNVTYSWTGNSVAQCCGSVAIATAATAPVQVAEAINAPVVLSSAPTPGNILVATRQFVIAGGTGGPPPTPIDPPGNSYAAFGWVQYGGSSNRDPTSVSHAAVDILVRCVEEGDGDTFDLIEGSPQEYDIQISEWELI